MFRVIETVRIHEKIENATSHSKKATIKNQGLGRIKLSSKEPSGKNINKAKIIATSRPKIPSHFGKTLFLSTKIKTEKTITVIIVVELG